MTIREVGPVGPVGDFNKVQGTKKAQRKEQTPRTDKTTISHEGKEISQITNISKEIAKEVTSEKNTVRWDRIKEVREKYNIKEGVENYNIPKEALEETANRIFNVLFEEIS